MANDKHPTITYVLHRPYKQGLRALRRALKHNGLQVPMEMDVSGMIRRKRGINFGRCRVLCVCDPLLLLEATIADASAVNFFPLHVVVAERGCETTVQLVGLIGPRNSISNDRLEPPIGKLWTRTFQALERTGERQATHDRE